ncbi:MAG: class I SAM-dependent methyltransferase [Planctomycetota bacterium]|jgi:SAM-dependent methyltransferase
MQNYLAETTVAEIQARGVNLDRLSVLEIGAGRGGYSEVLNRVARSFIASDMEKNEYFEKSDVPFAIVDVAKTFPFRSEAFDLIYCSSVIEHVADPETMLSETYRVLRPGGLLHVSFPPFYSLTMVGGHQFKPFHLLGEKVAVSLTTLVRRTDIASYNTAFGTFGLYPLTISGVEKRLKSHNFEVEDVYARMSPVNTARLPGLLADLLTWHVCYLARKPGS